MAKFIVLYACIIDDDDAGIFVDHPFFGGVVDNKNDAELLQKSIINDRHLPGAKFTKVFSLADKTIKESIMLAKVQFSKMANDMYDMEDMQFRMKTRR